MCHLLLKSKYYSSRMKIKYNFNDNYACIFILTYLQGLILAPLPWKPDHAILVRQVGKCPGTLPLQS